MYHIALIAEEHCLASGLTGIMDLLHMANGCHGRDKPPLFGWGLYSADGRPVRTASGLQLAVDGDFDSLQRPHVLCLPGITYPSLNAYQQRLAGHGALHRLILRCHQAGSLLAANCTGVGWLAASGVLDGRQATISWWLTDWLRRRHPAIRLQPYAILAEDGPLLTSGAASAHYNLTLRLIERLGGTDLAIQCARLALIDRHRRSQAPYVDFQQFTGHDDPQIARAQQWQLEHLAEPFSLSRLATYLAVSERTLIRRFQQALGCAPLGYLQRLRLQAACRLLENSSMEVKEIANQIGYADLSSFRRLFKRELGCTPGEYRRASPPPPAYQTEP